MPCLSVSCLFPRATPASSRHGAEWQHVRGMNYGAGYRRQKRMTDDIQQGRRRESTQARTQETNTRQDWSARATGWSYICRHGRGAAGSGRKGIAGEERRLYVNRKRKAR